MTPTIHMNGTSRQELERQVEEAGQSLRVALDKIAAAAPNGRDYYPQGDQAFSMAAAEHRARVERVRSVLADYEQMYEAIANEVP